MKEGDIWGLPYFFKDGNMMKWDESTQYKDQQDVPVVQFLDGEE